MLDPQQARETEGSQVDAGVSSSTSAGGSAIQATALSPSHASFVSPAPSRTTDGSDDDPSPIPNAAEARDNTLPNNTLAAPKALVDPARPKKPGPKKRVTFAPCLITAVIEGDGPPPELSQHPSELEQHLVDHAEAAVRSDGIERSESPKPDSDNTIRPTRKRKGEEFEEAQTEVVETKRARREE